MTKRLFNVLGMVMLVVIVVFLSNWLRDTSPATSNPEQLEDNLEIQPDISQGTEENVSTSTLTIEDISQQINQLNLSLIDYVGEGNWLYRNYTTESQFESGVNPETGEALPKNRMWETWFHLDANGVPETVLMRNTGLDIEETEIAHWSNGTIRSLIREFEQPTEWSKTHPLQDDLCLDFVSPRMNLSDVDVSVFEQDTQNGTHHWILSLSAQYSEPIANVYGFTETEFVGTSVTCIKDLETGKTISIEVYELTSDNRQVLLERVSNVEVKYIDELPAEINLLLTQ